jgi:hypothetical protein
MDRKFTALLVIAATLITTLNTVLLSALYGFDPQHAVMSMISERSYWITLYFINTGILAFAIIVFSIPLSFYKAKK